jgi:uncharacterized protein
MLFRRSLIPMIIVIPIIIALLSGATALGYQASIVRYAKVPALAVSMLENGSYVGSISWIEVRVISPGSGVVYVSTEPLSDIDLQASARAAVMIASYLSNIDPFKYDYLISVRADAPIIGGPSAGSAMVAAIYSALTNTSLDPRVASTGMILPDGLIGPVGGVPEKVVAAATSGFKIIAIPWGQSIYSEVRYVRQNIGPITVIRPASFSVNVSDLANRYGASVVEVGTAEELLSVFTDGLFRISNVSMKPFLTDAEVSILYNAYRNLSMLQEKSLYSALEKLRGVGDRGIYSSINNLIASSRSYRNTSQNLLESGYYYPALSNIFTSYYIARLAENMASAYSSRDAGSYARSYIDNIERMLDNYRHLWSQYTNKQAYGINEIYILPEVFKRVYDAEENINTSMAYLGYGDVINALYYASYAEARLRSIDAWLSLMGVYPGYRVDREYVYRISSWIYSYASTSLSYLESLASSTGYQIPWIQDLETRASQASKLLGRGDLIGSTSISMDIIVNTTLTIHAMFSTNITGLSEIVRREAMRTLNDLGEASPISSRLYMQMGDYLLNSGNHAGAVGLYEQALIILRTSKLLIGQSLSLNQSQRVSAILNTGATEARNNGVNTTTAGVSQASEGSNTIANQNKGLEPSYMISRFIIFIAVGVIVVTVFIAIYIHRRAKIYHGI